MIKWNRVKKVNWDYFSNLFEIKYGLKLGGIISPGYFNIYLNDFDFKLNASGLGCH